jgi:hypothetical protein
VHDNRNYGLTWGLFVLKCSDTGIIDWTHFQWRYTSAGGLWKDMRTSKDGWVDVAGAFHNASYFLPILDGETLHLFYESFGQDKDENYYSCYSSFSPTGHSKTSKSKTKCKNHKYYFCNGYFNAPKKEWFIVRTNGMKKDRYVGRFRLLEKTDQGAEQGNGEE